MFTKLFTSLGIQEPIVECGTDVLDKTVGAAQVWIEFVSNQDNDVGNGFQVTYDSSDVAMTPAPVTETTTSEWFYT